MCMSRTGHFAVCEMSDVCKPKVGIKSPAFSAVKKKMCISKIKEITVMHTEMPFIFSLQ